MNIKDRDESEYPLRLAVDACVDKSIVVCDVYVQKVETTCESV